MKVYECGWSHTHEPTQRAMNFYTVYHSCKDLISWFTGFFRLYVFQHSPLILDSGFTLFLWANLEPLSCPPPINSSTGVVPLDHKAHFNETFSFHSDDRRTTGQSAAVWVTVSEQLKGLWELINGWRDRWINELIPQLRNQYVKKRWCKGILN